MTPGCPRGWISRPLAECGNWVSGGTPSTNTPSYWNGDIPWISAKSLRVFDIEDSEDRVTREGASSGTKLVPAGSVLFVVRGMSLAKEFRVGVTRREVAFNQDLRAVVPHSDVDARYLARYLRRSQLSILSHADNAAHGTRRLPTDVLAAIPIPLPPLSEQKRIAAILDQADAIRRKRRQAITVAGKLIPAIFDERFGNHSSGGGCIIAELGECADIVSGVTKGRRFNGQPTRMLPYLRVANVQDGRLDLSEIKTVEALPSDLEKLRLQPGDVLLTEGGDYDKLGRGALWEGQVENCIHQNHIFRVRTDRNRLLPVFFANYLQTAVAKAYFLRCAKKTTNLATINMRQLRALPVPLPPLSEQQDFQEEVAVVRDLDGKCAAAFDQSDGLFASLVQRAFRGEL